MVIRRLKCPINVLIITYLLFFLFHTFVLYIRYICTSALHKSAVIAVLLSCVPFIDLFLSAVLRSRAGVCVCWC